MNRATRLTLGVVALAVAASSGIIVGRLSIDAPPIPASTQPIILVEATDIAAQTIPQQSKDAFTLTVEAIAPPVPTHEVSAKAESTTAPSRARRAELARKRQALREAISNSEFVERVLSQPKRLTSSESRTGRGNRGRDVGDTSSRRR